MKKLFADKLPSGKVVVRDGHGWARVLTPPCGVSYCSIKHRWNVHVPNAFGEWTTVSIYDSKYGPMEGFERAIKLREKKLKCLLDHRLLPRIRNQYTPLPFGKRWGVRDPFTQTYVTFRTRSEAYSFNQQLIDQYIDEHTITRERMITIAKFG